jgi:glycopeptide antibiotics resistance protein
MSKSNNRIQNIKKVIRILLRIVFVVYLLLLLLVIVFKYPSGMTRPAIEAWLHGDKISRMPPKLIPFRTIITYVKSVQAVHDWFF